MGTQSTWEFSLRISPATISNMKIILALFGFFLTARCLPAPGVSILTECEGSKCHQKSAFGAGFDTAAADVSILSRCKDGKCNKDSAFGVDFSDSFSDDFFGSSSSDSDTWTIQRCQGSNCQQKTAFGRKKRGVFIGQECHGSKCHQKSGFGAGFDTAAADEAIKQYDVRTVNVTRIRHSEWISPTISPTISLVLQAPTPTLGLF